MQHVKDSQEIFVSRKYLMLNQLLADLNKRAYFQCNSTVQLENDVPFFLVSQNYPYSPFDYSYCTITFNSANAIRAAIYDLVTVGPVTFEGPDLLGGNSKNFAQKPLRIHFSGRHVTDDEPVALYFKKSMTVSFSFRNVSVFYTRGFYILVDSYTRKYEIIFESLEERHCLKGTLRAVRMGGARLILRLPRFCTVHFLFIAA
ncbi:hypothetical protein COOONC_01390 [Cooperia oncophora]